MKYIASLFSLVLICSCTGHEHYHDISSYGSEVIVEKVFVSVNRSQKISSLQQLIRDVENAYDLYLIIEDSETGKELKNLVDGTLYKLDDKVSKVLSIITDETVLEGLIELKEKQIIYCDDKDCINDLESQIKKLKGRLVVMLNSQKERINCNDLPEIIGRVRIQDLLVRYSNMDFKLAEYKFGLPSINQMIIESQLYRNGTINKELNVTSSEHELIENYAKSVSCCDLCIRNQRFSDDICTDCETARNLFEKYKNNAEWDF